MSDEKQNIIVEHALLNKDNLLMYLEIFNSFEKIMNRLISDFLRELESELFAHLGYSWIIINNFDNNAFERWYFTIQKKTWQNVYAIGLNPENQKLRNFCFYTWRNSDILKNPVTTVTEMLNQNYMKGRKYRDNDWYQAVDMHYLNWTDMETISKLYYKKEMITYFKEHMLKIKDIVEPIIDDELSKGLSQQTRRKN